MTIKGCNKKRYEKGKNDYKTLQTNMRCEKKHQKEIVMLSNAQYCKIMYVNAKLQRNTNSRQRSL